MQNHVKEKLSRDSKGNGKVSCVDNYDFQQRSEEVSSLYARAQLFIASPLDDINYPCCERGVQQDVCEKPAGMEQGL